MASENVSRPHTDRPSWCRLAPGSHAAVGDGMDFCRFWTRPGRSDETGSNFLIAPRWDESDSQRRRSFATRSSSTSAETSIVSWSGFGTRTPSASRRSTASRWSCSSGLGLRRHRRDAE
jgi:hypothetical protein